MKDPLDTKSRAYEILGVRRNATLQEVMTGYAKLDPGRRNDRAVIDAWHRMRRPEIRACEDIWEYEDPIVKIDDKGLPAPQPIPIEDLELPPSNWTRLVVLPLETGLLSDDFAQREIRYSVLPAYAAPLEIDAFTEFDS